MDFKKIRKAIVAGVTAGIGAAITYQVGVGWTFTAEKLGETAGAFAAVAVPVAWATWRAPNKPEPTVETRAGDFVPQRKF